MQSTFCCPVCASPLTREDKSLKCAAGHCFDLARQGYVNLLRSNQPREKRHGDDKRMVLARQAFLDGGYYEPLCSAVCALLPPLLKPGARVLDVGCGEGYYTARLLAALEGKDCRVAGVDISKDALILAARRERRLELAVASAARLPVADGSMDAVMNLFAPLAAEEFARVLAPGGLLLRAVVLEEHLMGLKRAIYDRAIPNPPPEPEIPGFRLRKEQAVRAQLHLTDAAQIENLFCMTPYYYKTGRADQEKLAACSELRTELAFGLYLYEKA